jgi:hypothetical protein
LVPVLVPVDFRKGHRFHKFLLLYNSFRVPSCSAEKHLRFTRRLSGLIGPVCQDFFHVHDLRGTLNVMQQSPEDHRKSFHDYPPMRRDLRQFCGRAIKSDSKPETFQMRINLERVTAQKKAVYGSAVANELVISTRVS